MLTQSQWEARVREVHSMLFHSKGTHQDLMDLNKKWIDSELLRKTPMGRSMYSRYEQGFVRGLQRAAYNEVWTKVEFCYVSETGILYSTHKDSVHPTTEAWYAAGKGAELGKLPGGHFWAGTSRPYSFLGGQKPPELPGQSERLPGQDFEGKGTPG